MYPLVNFYVTMEQHHVLMSKSTISMAIFNSYVANYQRVVSVTVSLVTWCNLAVKMDMLPICTVGMYIFAMLLSIMCTDLCGDIPWKRWSVQFFTTGLTLVTTRSAVCCFHGLGSPWFTSNRWPLQFVPVLWSSQEIFWVCLPSGWFLVIDNDFMVTQWDLMGFTLW